MTWLRNRVRPSPAIARAEQTRRELLATAEARERAADKAARDARWEAEARRAGNDPVEWLETGTITDPVRRGLT